MYPVKVCTVSLTTHIMSSQHYTGIYIVILNMRGLAWKACVHWNVQGSLLLQPTDRGKCWQFFVSVILWGPVDFIELILFEAACTYSSLDSDGVSCDVLICPSGWGWEHYSIQWLYDVFHSDGCSTPWRHLSLAYFLRKKQAGLSCWVTIFYLSTWTLFWPTRVYLNPFCPYPSLGRGLTELSIMPRWALSLKQPGFWTGTRRTRTAKWSICSEQVFKCLVSGEWNGGATQPTAVQAGRKQQAALFRDQDTPSEHKLMGVLGHNL